MVLQKLIFLGKPGFGAARSAFPVNATSESGAAWDWWIANASN